MDNKTKQIPESTMRKKIFFLFLMFLNSYSFAIVCQNEPVKTQINIQVDQVSYNYDLTSQQIRTINGNPSHHVLGLYKAQKTMQIIPLVHFKKRTNEHSLCASFKEITLNYNLKPVIFISKEAQAFSCTKKRTEQHESKHHEIEISNLHSLKQEIENRLQTIFYKSILLNSENHAKETIQSMNQYAIDQITNIINTKTKTEHSYLDSTENYTRESQFCPQNENIALSRMLLK